MLFIPAKYKFKKQQKGKKFNRIKILTNPLTYGQVGLKTLSFCRLSSKQLSSLFSFIKKKIKKRGKVVTSIFPQTSVSAKPIEVRMGKGKGNVSFWAAKIRPGTTLCEISTKYRAFCLKVLNSVRYKIPLKTKIITRR